MRIAGVDAQDAGGGLGVPGHHGVSTVRRDPDQQFDLTGFPHAVGKVDRKLGLADTAGVLVAVPPVRSASSRSTLAPRDW